MKRIPYILIVLLAVFFASCSKKPELKVYVLELSEENVSLTTTSATITAKYSYPTDISEVTLLLGTGSDMGNASSIAATLEENTLSATIDNLVAHTMYYYCFRYSNGVTFAETETRSFIIDNEYLLPVVETVEVTDITPSSAICTGNVTESGGVTIIDRGICWSKEHNPDYYDNKVSEGIGLGSYTCEMTELDYATTYYVRAYAINTYGTSYGEEIEFVTTPILPTVSTVYVTDITVSGALVGGNVTDSGGGTVIERGVCWGSTPNPTINNLHNVEGSGTGEFTSLLSGLSSNLEVHVRAYATNEAGTAYGLDMTFVTPSTSEFSVSETKRVQFAKSNLQYRASDDTWRFTSHQYDIVGAFNSNISPTYDGWIDLFGWGTGNNPTNTSQNNSTYAEFNDWGVNNIMNGIDTVAWRTLTVDEWDYLLNLRNTNSHKRFAKAKLGSTNGIIILPDDWSTSTYTLSQANVNTVDYSLNTIDMLTWNTKFEPAGAIFLPVAGTRNGTTYNDVNHTVGGYWTATENGSTNARCLLFSDTSLRLDTYARRYGFAVRLVYDVE